MQVKPLAKQKDVVSDRMKALLAGAVLGMTIDPAPADAEEKKALKQILAAAAETGETMCQVGVWGVKMRPNSRSSVDVGKLRQVLMEAGLSQFKGLLEFGQRLEDIHTTPLTLDDIDALIAAATTTSSWAELDVDEIKPQKQENGVPRPRKGPQKTTRFLPKKRPKVTQSIVYSAKKKRGGK